MTITLSENILALGITEQHCLNCQLAPQKEALDLVDAGKDMFNRDQSMTAATLNCWKKMQAGALNDNITLQLVSAYRSVEYQCTVIGDKLRGGRSIDDILKVNAIPGYSEHHTGRALDLSTPGCDALEEAFEDTEAFAWLTNHAKAYHFYMTYPRDNPASIAYEPWHWTYKPE